MDKKTAFINKQKIELDVPPKVINGRTLLPVRFLSENFGCEVGWDDASRTINIKRNKTNKETALDVKETLSNKKPKIEISAKKIYTEMVSIQNQIKDKYELSYTAEIKFDMFASDGNTVINSYQQKLDRELKKESNDKFYFEEITTSEETENGENQSEENKLALFKDEGEVACASRNDAILQIVSQDEVKSYITEDETIYSETIANNFKRAFWGASTQGPAYHMSSEFKINSQEELNELLGSEIGTLGEYKSRR